MSLTNSESIEGLRHDFGKLLDEGLLFADARLVCFEQISEGARKRVEFPVHRVILAARSQYFANKFANGVTKEMEFSEAELNPKLLRAMLAHIYHGKSPENLSDDAELFSLCKAAKSYGLDIFEIKIHNVQSELVIDNFPKNVHPKHAAATTKYMKRQGQWVENVRGGNSSSFPADQKNYGRTFHGRQIGGIYPQDWHTQLRMEARWAETAAADKRRMMHIDFTLDPPPKSLVSDLSLCILDSPCGETLKIVKREGVFRGRINWSNCLDYYEIVRENLLHHRGKFTGGRRSKRSIIGRPQLIVRCEATFYVARETQSHFWRNKIDLSKDEKVISRKMQTDFRALLESGLFSDARIVVCFDEKTGEKVTIPVHQAILAARSKFFAAAFSVEMREAKTGEIVVPPESGFSVETIRAMLSYVYTGAIPRELDKNEMALVTLFKAAHFYQIEGLLAFCVALFELSPENCCEMLSLADLYICSGLKQRALGYIRLNVKKVKATEGWRQLMEESGRVELKMELPLTVENCSELLELAETHGNEQLKREALEFIRLSKKEN